MQLLHAYPSEQTKGG